MNPERILGALVRDALLGGSGMRHRRQVRRGGGSFLGPGMKGMRIVRTLEESGLDPAERNALLAELEKPVDLATIAARATTPALKRDVYLASEMAIDADTRAEQNYLARLAKQLGLSDQQVTELRAILAGAGDDAV